HHISTLSLHDALPIYFSFKARNRQGETVSGERAADSRQALALTLRREQIFLLEAQEKKTTKRSFEFGGNPTAKDVAVFTRQFSRSEEHTSELQSPYDL